MLVDSSCGTCRTYVTLVPMPRRDHLSAEWARIGARVAKLPPRLVRRLLGALDCLTVADSGDAIEAVAAMEEIARDGRADLTQEERLALLRQRTAEAQQAHAGDLPSRTTRRMRKPSTRAY
jgi:hypothetical protein